MPIELSDQQVCYIEAFLISNGLEYAPLQEELLDHVCCMVESKMEAGQKIKKGDLIGLVGSSGTSTAPHLHYEVIKNGEKVDPVEYFKP